MIVSILGKNWKIKLVTPRTYEKHHGQDSDAICVLSKRTIYFRKDEFNLEVIRHELFHAYYDESMTYSTSPTPEQVEEISAEIVGRYAPEICEVAKQILNHFSA